MDQDKRQSLIALKTDILRDIVPLVQEGNFEPLQKFELLLSAARISDDPARYREAYEVVKQIENIDDKTNAMLDLLDSVEQVTAQTSEQSPGQAPSVPEQPASNDQG
jgi:hypothetical protein